MNLPKARGFTLVEVLIASAIIVISIGMLMGLFGSGLNRLKHVDRSAANIVAEREIINRLYGINPAITSTGDGEVAGIRYSWRAEPIKPFRPVSGLFGDSTVTATATRYIALFAIDIELYPQSGNRRSFQIKRLGWSNKP